MPGIDHTCTAAAADAAAAFVTDTHSTTADTELGGVLEILNRARALANQKNFLEAEELCLEALKLAGELVGESSSIYGLCLEDLGANRVCQGKFRQAEVTLSAALNVLETALGHEHADVARVFSRLHELCHI